MVNLRTSRSNHSPLYPPSQTDFSENTISAANGLYMSIVLAEPHIFLSGFEKHECQDQIPALLRGSLVIRTTKPTKIKSVTLSFNGTAKTEWPEGIPPSKTDLTETDSLYSHIWPFFDASFQTATLSSGAHLVRLIRDAPMQHEEGSPQPQSSAKKSFFKMRSASPAPAPRGSSNNTGGDSSRTSKNRSDSPPAPEVSLAPHRSFSKQEQQDLEVNSKGYRVFAPGEYIYNFELPIPHSLPETMCTPYGEVKYLLQATVCRPGTFKSKMVGFKDVDVIRATTSNSLEYSEPINIDKQWENQLRYNILIAGKLFTIGTYIPISFRFKRLDPDMKCHRIRVYLTENVEYYCRQQQVHRSEPHRRYLLKEVIAEDGLNGSILSGNNGEIDSFEHQAYIPRKFSKQKEAKIHPTSTYDNIKVHHWIKIVLRLSKVEDRRKYFEISIDSPISLLHPECSRQNLELPRYSMSSNMGRNPSSVGIPISNSVGVPGSNSMSIPDPNKLEKQPSYSSLLPPPSYGTSTGIRASPPEYQHETRTKQLEDVHDSNSDDDFHGYHAASHDERHTGESHSAGLSLHEQLANYSIQANAQDHHLQEDGDSVPPLSAGNSESTTPNVSLVDIPFETKHIDPDRSIWIG